MQYHPTANFFPEQKRKIPREVLGNRRKMQEKKNTNSASTLLLWLFGDALYSLMS